MIAYYIKGGLWFNVHQGAAGLVCMENGMKSLVKYIVLLALFSSNTMAGNNDNSEQYVSKYAQEGISEQLIIDSELSMMQIRDKEGNTLKSIPTHFCEESSGFLCFKNKEIEFAIPKVLNDQKSWTYHNMRFCVVNDLNDLDTNIGLKFVWIEFGPEIDCGNIPDSAHRATFIEDRGLTLLQFGSYSLGAINAQGFGNYIHLHLPKEIANIQSEPRTCNVETKLWSLLNKRFANVTRYYQFIGTELASTANYSNTFSYQKITPSLTALQLTINGRPSRGILLGAALDKNEVKYQLSFLQETDGLSNPVYRGHVVTGKCELEFVTEASVIKVGSAANFEYIKSITNEGELLELRFL